MHITPCQAKVSETRQAQFPSHLHFCSVCILSVLMLRKELDNTSWVVKTRGGGKRCEKLCKRVTIQYILWHTLRSVQKLTCLSAASIAVKPTLQNLQGLNIVLQYHIPALARRHWIISNNPKSLEIRDELHYEGRRKSPWAPKTMQVLPRTAWMQDGISVLTLLILQGSMHTLFVGYADFLYKPTWFVKLCKARRWLRGCFAIGFSGSRRRAMVQCIPILTNVERIFLGLQSQAQKVRLFQN